MSQAAAERWARSRSFHHSLYPARRIAVERRHSISVCLPARECAQTVGEIVTALTGLCEAGAIDEVVVVDAASPDGTAAVAERAGARVLQEAELLGPFGPVLGKGDAMWRATSALAGELVCFLDADTEGFSAHFATGLLGPLVCEPEASRVSFVKGFYRRPLAGEGEAGAPAGPSPSSGGEGGGAGERPGEGGGRVNHLTARPALALFYPELAGVRQPLAGEVAARRELLEALPFATGYGVEIAMLIDAWREVGLEGMAQVDLEEHRNRHQPLAALAPMAQTVLATVAARLAREGRLLAGADGEGQSFDGQLPGAPVERPPLAGLRAEQAAK
ncbi:MAG TPA: glucosyl-3-phosphoglycerate synthase [Solirubrobacteraceae bacterium]|nr:glucosyl-3-phosphoglycerate synthase [Solirubrobacteraceae bacterium]